MEDLNLRADIDTGNNSMKISINKDRFKFPSVIAFENDEDEHEKVSFDTPEDKDEYFKHFLDHMYASISSSSVQRSGRFYLGNSAVSRGQNVEGFDINDVSGKAGDDLTMMLNLTTIAAYGVRSAYLKGMDVSQQISCNVNLFTALPIEEGKQKDVIKNYTDKYVKCDHVVNFHNLPEPITVHLHFKSIYVGLEGEVAQLSVVNAPKFLPDLADKMEQDLHQNYSDLANVTSQMIAKAPNVLVIEIGGKTVDFAVISNGKANRTLSDSMITGYDTVLQNALDDLTKLHYNFKNIASLQSYLKQPENPFAPASKNKVEDVITGRTQAFSDEIIRYTSRILRAAGQNVQLIMVMGGGSIPMAKKSHLRAQLRQKVRHFNGGDDLPIIWIDKQYAQYMNLLGLLLIDEASKKLVGSDQHDAQE